MRVNQLYKTSGCETSSVKFSSSPGRPRHHLCIDRDVILASDAVIHTYKTLRSDYCSVLVSRIVHVGVRLTVGPLIHHTHVSIKGKV